VTAQGGRPHGNAKYHLEHCRCPICCEAARAYDNNRRRAIAYGRWQPYVDAEPVRTHVKALAEFGIGWMRLAKISGVPRGSVSKLLYGDPQRGMAPSKRMLPKNAQAILAVEPVLEHLGARVPIDGTGTRRRLQALVAKGWSQSELARRLGTGRANFGGTITRGLVYAGTHRAALALYDELWRLDPEHHGVPARWAEQARAIAADHQWAPPGAWDDDQIDDPAAHPDWTGHCGTPEGYRIHYRIRVPVCPPCRDARTEQRTAA
jgi:transcriptional regulator with XRE-family HTH domain